MDKYLRPVRFGSDPTSPNSAREFTHWLQTFNNFLVSIAEHGPNKLNTLVNYVTSDVFDYIEGITVYEEAIQRLSDIYVQPENVVFARHVLATRSQKDGESIDTYVQVLR